jgi:hypothetical protein
VAATIGQGFPHSRAHFQQNSLAGKARSGAGKVRRALQVGATIFRTNARGPTGRPTHHAHAYLPLTARAAEEHDLQHRRLPPHHQVGATSIIQGPHPDFHRPC